MKPAIELKEVTKCYGSLKALDGISLAIDSGTIFGLLGPNGAGKSTIMRICSTLLKPDDGRVHFDGMPASDSSDRLRQSLAIMTQGKALDPMLNVKDNLVFYGKLRRFDRNRIRNEIERVVDLFGLDEFLEKSVWAISGGQFRRAQLARTFMGTPKYLLLDEPTLGIDILAKISIWSAIRKLVSNGECTVLLASNDMTEIEKSCSRVGFLNHGKLLFTGETQRLSTESAVSLDCKLARPYSQGTCPAPGGLTVRIDCADSVSVTFQNYSDVVMTFLKNLNDTSGIMELSECRMSLTDLFDKYGGDDQ